MSNHELKTPAKKPELIMPQRSSTTTTRRSTTPHNNEIFSTKTKYIVEILLKVTYKYNFEQNNTNLIRSVI